MELLTLFVARTVKNPFALNSEATEERPQPEPELRAIDFALIAQTKREMNQPTRGREAFSRRQAAPAFN
jgi:hypothetical protein